MELLPSDKEYLDSHGKDYSVIEMPGELHLILKNEAVSSICDQPKTDILIKIPQGYPSNPLDMFWVNPPLKYKSNGNTPPNADVFEPYQDKSWQRFSRHYPWKLSYSLCNHILLIKHVLLEEGEP